MKLTLFSGRTGRVVIVLLLVLLMTVAMFAVASLFMAWPSDPQLAASESLGAVWLAHHPLCWPGARLAVEGAAAGSAMLAADPPAPAELLAVLFILATEYVAWLFHHLEWLTQMEGATKSGRPWYPGLNVPADQWRVRPKASPAGGMSAMYMAIRLLPAEGLILLQRWPAISDSLLGFLAGSRAGSALLNSIVSDARNSCGFTGGTVTDVPPPAVVSPVMAVPETGHIPPQPYENEAAPLSGVGGALTPENHIATAVRPENGPRSVTPGSHAPDTALVSALGSEESIPSDDESDDLQQQEPGGNLLSMLDLMAEGQPLPSPDESSVLPGSVPAGEECISGVSRPERGKTETADGEVFLQWLRQSVTDGTLSVNESDSVLHILARFVFVASPDVFYKYTSSAGDAVQDKKQLQKSFEALSVHHSRNGKGLYHYHKYDAPDKSGGFIKVSGYMIETNLIFRKGSCPPDSIWLSPRS
uniref:Putative conjugal transfer nickase/helicase TraI C-terminal domain-containing protein n=1 Tax=Erwinia amylovora ATCC BAA-2158 TaxID=889211 RepID=E5B1S4_ERWAM|nr:hypothetical protein EAIL5_0605 [Erwinia amylovora ATCC BAA-2158]